MDADTDEEGRIYRSAQTSSCSETIPKDLLDIMNLFNASYQDTSFRFLPSYAKTPITEHRIQNEWLSDQRAISHWVVIEANGGLIGSAHVGASRSQGQDFSNYLSIIIHPNFQGQGVGTRLCRHVLSDALGNVDEVEVVTNIKNLAVQRIMKRIGGLLLVQKRNHGTNELKFVIRKQGLDQP